MKKVSILFIVSGILFLGFGGYQWYKSERSQDESLDEAEALLDKKEMIDGNHQPISEIAQSFSPSTGDAIGILYIPELDSNLPIVEGTDEDELEKGIGHYKGTAYPLQNDQIVLSGHRDTVFRRMGELVLGDLLTIKLPYGDFSYEIVDTKIVKADDRTIIMPTAPDEVLTLTTCYPFTFIGSAPDRYIITALPVSKKSE